MIRPNVSMLQHFSSSDLRLNTTASLFDDDDLGVEPVQLLSAFGASAAGVGDGTRPADSATPAELQGNQQLFCVEILFFSIGFCVEICYCFTSNIGNVTGDK